MVKRPPKYKNHIAMKRKLLNNNAERTWNLYLALKQAYENIHTRIGGF